MQFGRHGLAAIVLCLSVLWSASPARAAEPARAEWNPAWPRFRLWQAVTTVGLGAGAGAIALFWNPPSEARMRGGVLFDDAVRGALGGRTRAVQTTASRVSDVLYLGGTAAPLVIDAGVVALGIHRDGDLALQLLLLDLQSLAVSGVISLSFEHGAGRARPYTEDCAADGRTRDDEGRALLHSCGKTTDNKSLFSGHAAAVTTMAGLTCAHHRNIPLYGGGPADVAACLTTIAFALGTGVGRIVADEHWASDVLLGWGVGAASGYLLPTLLHYGFDGRGVGHAPRSAATQWASPSLALRRDGVALGWAAVF